MENNVALMVHPASLEDFKRDPESPRKSIHTSKFGKYPILEDPGIPDDHFIALVGEGTRDQDKVDNKILYSIYKEAVNNLITEDKGIHKKARKLKFSDRVFTISKAEQYLTELFREYTPQHLSIDDIPIHELDHKSDFFNSLREDYPEFDKWFIEKSREGRRCWCWRDKKGNLKAILIYAKKKRSVFRDSSENTLKICTFKVSEDVIGFKIGELLLKLCFEYCSENNLDSTFVTTFPKKAYLIKLLDDFGFIKIGDKSNGEVIYAKDFLTPDLLGDLHPFEYDKKYFPKFYDGARVRKFIIPIRPEFHDRLFADAKRSQKYVDEFEPLIVEQNTIRKAYICKSKITSIRPGDLLLFYRSVENQKITGIGIAERARRFTNHFQKLKKFVEPRSVYSIRELKEQFETEALAILFRYVSQLPKTVSREDLLRMEIIKGAPQSIQELDNKFYKKLKESVS